jgi:hypothetical protein
VCQSNVGRIGGQQFVDLATTCIWGSIAHEVGHAFGFKHEHMRSDRNSFIQVNYGNIDEMSNWDQFFRIEDGSAYLSGAYDLGSIMHYGPLSFSKDKLAPTIQAIVPIPAGVTMGQRDGLSTGDQASFRTLYCNASLWKNWPAPLQFTYGAGSAQFTIQAPQFCTYQITETSGWITVTSQKTVTGVTTVTFSFLTNTTYDYRTAYIKVGTRNVTIKQEPKILPDANL